VPPLLHKAHWRWDIFGIDLQPLDPMTRRSAGLELAAVVLGALLAAAWLAFFSRGPETDFEDFALGEATTTLYAAVDGHPIHCKTLEDAKTCIEGFRARGLDRVALWLGNSQIHSLNQQQPGDHTAAMLLFHPLQERGVDFLTFSQPNANLQEHLVLLANLAPQLPVEWLILPVVFDDLRETGIRPEIAPALDDPATVAALSKFPIGEQIMAQQPQTETNDLAALDETVQEATETGLNAWLESHVALWAARPEIRGRILTELLAFRNRVFGIDAQSTRKMIPSRYRANLDALAATLALASETGIRTTTYIVPIRDDVEVPYDAGEYARFQTEVEGLAQEHGATFANLGPIVPGELWGMQDATDGVGEPEYDFMHFQARGHALLAEALAALLDPQIAEVTQ
jgi:hypothetical protein